MADLALNHFANILIVAARTSNDSLLFADGACFAHRSFQFQKIGGLKIDDGYVLSVFFVWKAGLHQLRQGQRKEGTKCGQELVLVEMEPSGTLGTHTLWKSEADFSCVFALSWHRSMSAK